MSRYDGLIIPRSYSEYINKTDAATLQQALQLSGVLSGAVAAGDNKAVKSSAVNNALANYGKIAITDITDADLAISDEDKQQIFYISNTGSNLPSGNILSGDIICTRGVNFLSQVFINFYGVQWTRRGQKNNNIWTFETWEKITTESDLNITRVWNGEVYQLNETVTIPNFSANKKYLLQFKAFSVSYTVSFPISFLNSNYIQCNVLGEASQFARYRFILNPNTGVITVSDVTNGSTNNALVGIYEI